MSENGEDKNTEVRIQKTEWRIDLNVAYAGPERRGVCAENLDAATPVSRRKMTYMPMVDDTKSGILKHKPDEEYRRLQQGFEAFRPAFL